MRVVHRSTPTSETSSVCRRGIDKDPKRFLDGIGNQYVRPVGRAVGGRSVGFVEGPKGTVADEDGMEEATGTSAVDEIRSGGGDEESNG